MPSDLLVRAETLKLRRVSERLLALSRVNASPEYRGGLERQRSKLERERSRLRHLLYG